MSLYVFSVLNHLTELYRFSYSSYSEINPKPYLSTRIRKPGACAYVWVGRDIRAPLFSFWNELWQ